MRDVIVVGGGLGGVSAAWRLRNRDILLLEANNRVGGRIRSERRGMYWLNWGGHLFGGPGSYAEKLLQEVEVVALDLTGSFTAFHYKGKTLNDGSVFCYPFKLPISWSSRLEVVKTGLKIFPKLLKYGKICKERKGEDYRIRQQRIYDFLSDQTFSDFTGPLSDDADAFFRPTVSRSSGNSEEISAGSGIGYFLLVWDKSAGLARNVVGGPSTLVEAIAHRLGEKVQLGAEVIETIQHSDHVEVIYKKDGQEFTEKARYCVMATPAPITHKVTKGLDPVLHDAIGQIKYGTHIAGAFLTNEKGPQVWDKVYGYSTPGKSFTILLNQSNLVRSTETGERADGSSFMVFSPAKYGHALLDLPNEEILKRYRQDLNSVFPGFEKYIVEEEVEKFKYGAAYCFPGRNKIQPILMRPRDRVYLAGDYLGSWYTETAIQTGLLAGEDINSKLYTEELLPPNDFKY